MNMNVHICCADSLFADINSTSTVSVNDGATASFLHCRLLRNTLQVEAKGLEKSGAVVVTAGVTYNTAARVEECEFDTVDSDFLFIKRSPQQAAQRGHTGACAIPMTQDIR